MRSHRAFVLALIPLAAAGLAGSALATQPKPDPTSVLYFLVALTLVGTLDVWLPRGDYSEMGGAVALAAALTLGPLQAAGVVALSRLIVWATRRFSESPWRIAEDVARRFFLLSCALGLFGLLGGKLGVLPAVGRGDLPRVLAVAVLYFALDMAVTQLSASLRLGTPYLPLLVGNLRLQGWLATAQVSAAVLAVLTYGTMGPLGLGIVTGLLLVMRQSFSLLIDVRQAYRSTIEVLARAIEAYDPQRRGHAERVGHLSTETGRLLGLHGERLEALTHAALFHDVGRLDTEAPAAAQLGSAEVLKNVGFLALSVPILRIIDLRGVIESSQAEADLVAAYVITRMSEYDELKNGLTAPETEGVADEIGSRLYADTRHAVDKAIRRVELRAEAGRLTATRGALEESW